jgi:hypothetical protein
VVSGWSIVQRDIAAKKSRSSSQESHGDDEGVALICDTSSSNLILVQFSRTLVPEATQHSPDKFAPEGFNEVSETTKHVEMDVGDGWTRALENSYESLVLS